MDNSLFFHSMFLHWKLACLITENPTFLLFAFAYVISAHLFLTFLNQFA